LLSNGATVALISTLRAPLIAVASQIAAGACALTSFSTGNPMLYGQAMSTWPAMNAMFRVETFWMIDHSMPSR
jgi:hypothetical protein